MIAAISTTVLLMIVIAVFCGAVAAYLEHFRILKLELDCSKDQLKRSEFRYEQLKSELSELEADFVEKERSYDMLCAANEHHKAVITTLRKRHGMNSPESLTKGISSILRFIGSNQWILETDRELANSFGSVAEVAESVSSREEE